MVLQLSGSHLTSTQKAWVQAQNQKEQTNPKHSNSKSNNNTILSSITSYQSTITDVIRSVMQSHTNDDISEEIIKRESLELIREKFGTKCVVELTLKNFMHQ